MSHDETAAGQLADSDEPTMTLHARCQCGLVRFPLPTPLTTTYVCHCTECRLQSASAFGVSAIFPLPSPPPSPSLPFPLNYLPSPLSDLVKVFIRPTESGKTLLCVFCGACGTRLLHLSEGTTYLSVKGGAVEGLDWKKVWQGKHIWTKSAVVDIPEGVERWEEEPDE